MALASLNIFWRHRETTGNKKQTSGTKWVKILSKIDIHIEAWSLKFMLFYSNDFHKLATIVTESSILDVRRDPEPTSPMILPNK